MTKETTPAEAEVARLEAWVDDLQAGMYINCVYCGHRYGPNNEVEPTMQQVLYDHIKVCPKHPLSEALTEVARLTEANRGLREQAPREIVNALSENGFIDNEPAEIDTAERIVLEAIARAAFAPPEPTANPVRDSSRTEKENENA